ncbi:unnamed protein product [Amoebophrya sp. A25]|nr:unnamed protein product [Amoebophrya sp. A25]|eukprot:GSA25T00002733001.1
MPKIRTLRTKKAPAGFEDVEPVLTELNEKLKEAVNESHEGKRKNEAQWPIFRIEHQMSRYIYELFWRKKQISRELYDWLCEEKYVNQALISKWRKPGYERLCCMKCIQPKDSNFGTTCICRVPQHKLHNREKVIECQHCGCRGCASGDQKVVRPNNTKSGAVITSGGLEAAGIDSSLMVAEIRRKATEENAKSMVEGFSVPQSYQREVNLMMNSSCDGEDILHSVTCWSRCAGCGC